MNQFPLCAAEKSLSFVIGSRTISCPIKVCVVQYILNVRESAWRGKKSFSYYPAGGCLHLHGNNVKIEGRHDCYFKQISMERRSALSGRLCFRKSSDLFSHTCLRPPFPLPTNVCNI